MITFMALFSNQGGIRLADRKKSSIEGKRGELIRVNKYLSEAGVCSRREADRYIESGRVKVNGEVAMPGTKVGSADTVYVDNKKISICEKLELIAFNKPVGIECTSDRSDDKNIIDYIGYNKRIYPVGRLDQASEGLILLTNDGHMTNELLRAANYHEKEYEVTVNKKVTEEFVKRMSSGVKILDTVTRKCSVQKTGEYTFKIILTQGLNRQIRRMCETLGYRVTKLKRIRIMNIRLGNLKVGTYRKLTEDEIDILYKNLRIRQVGRGEQ